MKLALIFLAALISCQAAPQRKELLELSAEEISPGRYLCRITNSTSNSFVVQGFSIGVPNPRYLVDFWNGNEWEDPLPTRCGTGLDPLYVEPGESREFMASFKSSNLPGLRVQAWEVVGENWQGPLDIVWWQSNQPLQQTRFAGC